MIPTVDTLQRAGDIIRQIEALQAELAGLFGGGSSPQASVAKRRGRPPGAAKPAAAAAAPASKRQHRMSAEGRARIAAAAKARWAKFRAEKKKGARPAA